MEMALNPQLYGNGTPVPFVDELFVLRRDAVDFEVDKVAEYVDWKLYILVFPKKYSKFFVEHVFVVNMLYISSAQSGFAMFNHT